MKHDSAVEFPTISRIHIGLAVSDIARSTQFYRTLFGVQPTKERPGYAKFEPHDPPVNLSLNQVADALTPANPASHFGIQVKGSQAVEQAAARFRQAGIETAVEQETTCCYAVQNKVWVADPDGNRWEVFVVLDNDAGTRKDETSVCCGQAQSSSCC